MSSEAVSPIKKSFVKVDNPKPIYLEWNDHWGMGGGWRDIADIRDPGPSLCRTLGWLVGEDRIGYYVSSGLCPDSGAPHTMIMYVIKKDVTKKKWLRGI